jgi:hypothetical protein
VGDLNFEPGNVDAGLCQRLGLVDVGHGEPVKKPARGGLG